MEFYDRIRARVDWWRSRGGDAEALQGAWVPDPTDDDFPYISSLVFADGVKWSIIRDQHGRHDRPADYRVTRHWRIITMHRSPAGDGRWTSTPFRFDPDGALVLDRTRFIRTVDPDAREWPLGAVLSDVDSVGIH